MAEPIGLAASIIGLLEASKVVCSYLYTIKNASTESRKLLLDIQYIEGLLEILKETVQHVQEAAKWDSTVQVLNSTGNPLEVLRQVLSSLEAKLKEAAAKEGFKKILALATFPLTKKETDEVVQTIERQKALLVIALNNDHLLLSAEIQKQVSSIEKEVKQITVGVQDINVKLEPVRKNVEDQKTRESLEWLSKITYQSTQDEIYQQRLPSSLSWFFALAEFQTWMAGGGKTLLCSGIAGAGKSVLAATVIQHLLDRFKTSTGDVGIAWIYCSFRARQQQTPRQMLASIATQLVRQSEKLLHLVAAMSKNADTEPRLDQLLEILAECKATFKSMYIVIDALDEYSEDSHGWMPFVEDLQYTGTAANFLITARSMASIEHHFTDALRVEISAREEDITAYIDNELQSPIFQRHLSNDKDLRAHIAQQLLEKSQGMFLLTKLHMDSLRQKAKYNKNALKKAAERLPEQLDETYDNTFQRIHSQADDDAQLAIQVIAWIHYSFEDLAVRQLQQAIACWNEEDMFDEDSMIEVELLLSVCAGLVILNSETGAVRLMHTTVAEYLDRYFANAQSDAQFIIHHTCVKLMVSSSLLSKLMEVRQYWGDSQWWLYELKNDRKGPEAQIEALYVGFPFFRYVDQHVKRLDWPYKIEVVKQDVLHRADNLILNDCCRTADVKKDLPLAVFVNDIPRVENILKDPDDSHSPTTLSRWLVYSILRGNDDISRLLFYAGADVNAEHTVWTDMIGQYHRGPERHTPKSCAFQVVNTELMDLFQSGQVT